MVLDIDAMAQITRLSLCLYVLVRVCLCVCACVYVCTVIYGAHVLHLLLDLSLSRFFCHAQCCRAPLARTKFASDSANTWSGNGTCCACAHVCVSLLMHIIKTICVLSGNKLSNSNRFERRIFWIMGACDGAGEARLPCG